MSIQIGFMEKAYDVPIHARMLPNRKLWRVFTEWNREKFLILMIKQTIIIVKTSSDLKGKGSFTPEFLNDQDFQWISLFVYFNTLDERDSQLGVHIRVGCDGIILRNGGGGVKLFSYIGDKDLFAYFDWIKLAWMLHSDKSAIPELETNIRTECPQQGVVQFMIKIRGMVTQLNLVCCSICNFFDISCFNKFVGLLHIFYLPMGDIDLVPATPNDNIHGNHKCLGLVEYMNGKEDDISFIPTCLGGIPSIDVGGYLFIEGINILPSAPRGLYEAEMQLALEEKMSEFVDMLGTCGHSLHMLSSDPAYCFRFSIPLLLYNATHFLLEPLIGRRFDETSFVMEAITSTIFASITKDARCGVAILELGVVHVIAFCAKHSKHWHALLQAFSLRPINPLFSQWNCHVNFDKIPGGLDIWSLKSHLTSNSGEFIGDTDKAIDGIVIKCLSTIERICDDTFRCLIHVRITSELLG